VYNYTTLAVGIWLYASCGCQNKVFLFFFLPILGINVKNYTKIGKKGRKKAFDNFNNNHPSFCSNASPPSIYPISFFHSNY